MKKTKLLIPALSIVGLATAVVPMVATSCSNKGTWEKSSYEEFKAKMDPLYETFNKQNNYNSFEPNDLVVKYNGVNTTNYNINNYFSFVDSDAKTFDSKNISIRLIDTEGAPDAHLFYPKKDIEKTVETGIIPIVTKKNNSYKLYLQGNEGIRHYEYTYIINDKGYSTYYGVKITDLLTEETLEDHQFNIEYKSDLHEVSDFTFTSKKDNTYQKLTCIMKNDTEYKFNVKKSTSELSKFKIIYYDTDGNAIHTLDLQDGVTVTAGGETVTTSWSTNHLEFATIATDKDISITLNKSTLPEEYKKFEVSIYN